MTARLPNPPEGSTRASMARKRLNALRYDFLHADQANTAVETALRFTTSVQGLHIALTGTTKTKEHHA